MTAYSTMPGGDYNLSSSQSATMPFWLGLNEVQHEAAGFDMATKGVLEAIELPLRFGGGTNVVDLSLVGNRVGSAQGGTVADEPDPTDLVEHWRLVNRTRSSGDLIVRVESLLSPELVAGKRYWVVLSVPEPHTGVAWNSASTESEAPAFRAERNHAHGLTWDDWSSFFEEGGGRGLSVDVLVP